MALDRSDDSLLTPFVWGKGGKRKTQDEIDADKKLALLLMKSGSDYSPVQHWTQGGARVMQALAGVVRENRANSAALQNANLSAQNIATMLGANQPQGPSVVPNTPTHPQSPATVKPTEPFQPQVQAQPSPFVKPEGSITPEQPFVPTATPPQSPPAPPPDLRSRVPWGGNQMPAQQNPAAATAPSPLAFEVDGLPIRYVGNGQGYFDGPADRKWKGIVVHHTAGPTLDGALSVLQKGDAARNGGRFGYHFYIDRDGSVHQAAPLSAMTQHVAAAARRGRHDLQNNSALGISFVGSGQETPEQIAAGRKLVEALQKKYGIKTEDIVGHGEVQFSRMPSEGMSLVNQLRQAALAQQQAPAAPVSAPQLSGPTWDAMNAPQMAEAPPQEMVQRPVQVASLDGVNPQDVLQARPDVASANVNPQEVMQPAQEQVAQAPFSMNDAMAANSMLPPLAQQQQPIMPPQQAPAAPPPPPPPPAAPQAPQRPQVDPRIIQSLTSPYSSPQERAIAMELIKPHITPSQQQFSPLPNGMVLRKDPRSGRAEVVNPYTQQIVTDPNQIPQGLRNTQYGVTPQFAKKNGRLGMYQLGNDGTLKFHELPDDVDLAPGFDKVDLGTHFELRDKKTGQVVDVIKKDIAGAKQEEVVGKDRGENITKLPKVLADSDSALDVINGILNDPNLDDALGIIGSRKPDWYDRNLPRVRARIGQLEGKNFLQAFNDLKGGGQITEIEGKKATEAMARLRPDMDPKDYRAALEELRDIVRAARQRAIDNAAGAKPQQQNTAPPTTTPQRIRIDQNGQIIQ